VFDNVKLGKYLPAQAFQASVDPSGIFLGKAMPL